MMMMNGYTLSTTPLVPSSPQLRWNIDTSSSQTPLKLANGRVTLGGWMLAENQQSPRLAVKNGHATYSYPFNVKRPDVISAILQKPVDNHPRLVCGFNLNISFSSQITLGLESGGLITWFAELNFSPAC